ncbi:MAG: right-handed parallel beta-helix repeat-containing protein [Chitinophagaceae bacterium]|nr:right-handed parallel beta-helix repeat-containing protein [Chitinophagaceae bacterium]
MLVFSKIFRFGLIYSLIFSISNFSYAENVKNFGAKGDGKTDDTYAINKAILGCRDGIIEFPRGNYRITQTISIDLSKNGVLGISGKGGSASIIMAGEGPAFCFIGSHVGSALPSSVKPVTWERERMPLIDALEIVGANPKADGIEIRNALMPVFRALLIRDVRNGLHFTSRNRNVLINACHIYNASGIGIYLDNVNIHQMIISNSHISYCKKGGIKVMNSEIRNFEITGNDIEYNCDPAGPISADIWIDCAQGGSVREGAISGNTIQAIPSPGGANIRFSGLPANSNKIGLWSITGNHISNQETNIELDHCRGVNVTGNTFIRGYDRHLIINGSRNITVSDNVFDHNDDYFTPGLVSLGGISVNKSQGIILNDNIIDGAEYGNEKKGGAVVITDSREVSISGCHIQNPKINGVQIDNSANVQVVNCIISEETSNPRMLAGIALNGSCAGALIRNNNLSAGKNGSIANNATGAIIEANIFTGRGGVSEKN